MSLISLNFFTQVYEKRSTFLKNLAVGPYKTILSFQRFSRLQSHRGALNSAPTTM